MVYIHIPYCRTRCIYCGFYSELLRQGRESATQKFVHSLLREINLSALSGELSDSTVVNTLYIGGGTPSLLSAAQIGTIAAEVARFCEGKDSFDEFTVEVNPDDIVRGGSVYCEALMASGVNRISMGVQSFDDRTLRRMGRRHDVSEVFEAYSILRGVGLENISLDLIFGYDAGMDLDLLLRGLERLSGGDAAALPSHLSCYQLSVEEGSALEKLSARGKYAMPTDEQCERQYYGICNLLAELGYEHYEISSWARDQRRSRHNSGYWNHTPYIGFGPGAHSLMVESRKYVRRWNNPDLHAYIAADSFDSLRGSETLSDEQVLRERIMLGLRTSEGVAKELLPPVAMELALQRGDLEKCGSRVRIPSTRWFVSDAIILNMI